MKAPALAAALLAAALLAAALLAGCQRPEQLPRPADLLPPRRLVPLIVGLHLLEARIESSRLSPDSARALYLEQKKTLLWQAEVSDSAFLHSYRYYSVHGKDLDDIYGMVADSLGQLEYRMSQ